MMNDEIQNEFNEFHDECLKLSWLCTKQKKIVSSLEGECKSMQDELDKVKSNFCTKKKKVKSNINTKIDCLTWNKCASLKSKIDELNQVICKYENGKNRSDNVLSSQITVST